MWHCGLLVSYSHMTCAATYVYRGSVLCVACHFMLVKGSMKHTTKGPSSWCLDVKVFTPFSCSFVTLMTNAVHCLLTIELQQAMYMCIMYVI